MSEMVERAARAIADRADDSYERSKEFYDAYARAAIEAMREPTSEMLIAGQAGVEVAAVHVPAWQRDECFQYIWRNVIDEALK
jgi:hypothetical protein